MKLKIKKVHQDAVIPKYETKGSVGFDLVSIEDVTIYPESTRLIRTGLSMEIPEGYMLQICPRSGISLKTKLRIANAPGVVDFDFRGEVCVIVTNISSYGNMISEPEIIRKGNRIAQGVICPIVQAEFEEVESLSETERDTNGFGSSGA